MNPEIVGLFVERFPKYTFAIHEWSPSPRLEIKALPEIPLDHGQILYLYGLDVDLALKLTSWLSTDPKQRLIFLEEDTGQIASFLEHPSAEEILFQKQIEIHHLPKGKAKIALIQELSTRYPSKGVFIFYRRGNRKEFSRFKLQLLRAAAISYNFQIEKLQIPSLLFNLLKNSAAIPSAFYVNRMKDAFASIPAIICGAGPSLEHAIDTLRGLQQRALIIAGGSAITALTLRGIKPHFAVATDPNFEEFYRLKNSSSFQIPLLFSPRLHPSCLATTNGPLGYIRTNMSGILPCWLEEAIGLREPYIGENLHRESLSVTTVSVAIAHHFGCNPILFEGMDLAYTENRRYIDGIDAREREEQILQPTDRPLDKLSRKRKKISSAVRWVMEAKALSAFAKSYPNRRWIQCTSDGLVLEDIESMPLNKAAKLFLVESDLYGRVQQAIASAPMPETIFPLLSEKLQELESSLDRLLEYLDDLVEKRAGLAILAELEIQEELAYKVLFYDIANTLEKASEDMTSYWKAFQKLALQCKQAFILRSHTPAAYCGES